MELTIECKGTEDRSKSCIDCYEWTNTECDVCKLPLCSDCNATHNANDCAESDAYDIENPPNDGLCWKCREKAAGTYDGEED